jgi:KipI family sensor histidine kinase inhibitor
MCAGAPPCFQVHEYGDSAVLVDFLSDDYESRWESARALGIALRKNPPRGFQDVVVTYHSVFVSFDCLQTGRDQIVADITSLTENVTLPPVGRVLEIPVLYGGEYGPDLIDVARELGVDPDDIVSLHSSSEWKVRFIASPPGAPFLDGPQWPAPIRRMGTPRPRVPVGSVAVSGFQSAIYTAPSPGGWRIIGRTPARLFDLHNEPPNACRTGDRIRFVPIAANSRAAQ